jgi:hypothetical protein
MVGRASELAEPAQASSVANERACRLVTVSGEAGIGKSRPSTNLHAGSPTVTRPVRSVPLYGDAITYWPIAGGCAGCRQIHDGDVASDVRRKLLLVCGDRVTGSVSSTPCRSSDRRCAAHWGESSWFVRRFLGDGGRGVGRAGSLRYPLGRANIARPARDYRGLAPTLLCSSSARRGRRYSSLARVGRGRPDAAVLAVRPLARR